MWTENQSTRPSFNQRVTYTKFGNCVAARFHVVGMCGPAGYKMSGDEVCQ